MNPTFGGFTEGIDSDSQQGFGMSRMSVLSSTKFIGPTVGGLVDGIDSDSQQGF
jgi:hypothetical protein